MKTPTGEGERQDGAGCGGDSEELTPPPPPPPYSADDHEEDPVLLAAGAVPSSVSGHRVCRVGQLAWCASCRWARPSGSRAPWPATCDKSLVEAEFAGDPSRVQLVHPVVFVRGLAICLRCGAFSTKRLVRLGTASCTPTAAGRKEIARVLRGRLPHKVRQWPLEPPAVGEED